MHNGNTCLPTLRAGKASDEKLKNQQIGTLHVQHVVYVYELCWN